MARSIYTQAAEMAASDMRRVIDEMDDAPFMTDKKSARTEGRHRYAEMARDVAGDAPLSVLERIGREMELEHGL